MTIQANENWSVGMELRDHFAGQALTGICSKSPFRPCPKEAAHWAYQFADAMLMERAGKGIRAGRPGGRTYDETSPAQGVEP